MPDIYTKVSIELGDYFDRDGFSGGDNAWLGYFNRQEALRILRNNLKRTAITAIGVDTEGDNRNNCMIGLDLKLYERKFKKKAVHHFPRAISRAKFGYCSNEPEFFIDDLDFKSVDLWEAGFGEAGCKEIVEALTKAEEEFNDFVLDDLSRVLNTPNKKLPLLIGKIKDKDALKLFERLLKGE